jgi:hypothetical protein
MLAVASKHALDGALLDGRSSFIKSKHVVTTVTKNRFSIQPNDCTKRCPNVTSDPNSSRHGTNSAVLIYVKGRWGRWIRFGQGAITTRRIRWRAPKVYR